MATEIRLLRAADEAEWRILWTAYLDFYETSVDAPVYRALIEAVYAEADKARCPAVYWLTQDFNAPARRLYDRVARVTPFIKYQR